jgi:hypothetical protein
MSIENFGLNSPVRTIIELCLDKDEIEWKGVLPSYKGEKLFPLVTEEDEKLLNYLFSIPSFYGRQNIITKKEVQSLMELDKHLDIPKIEYVCNTDYLTMCAKLLKRGICPEKEFVYEIKCEKAAENGYLEVLKWARENGRPWDEYTCIYAATNGHLDVLMWARENGCPWDEWTSVGAIASGNLELLKWVKEKGCPWDEEICNVDIKVVTGDDV